VWAHRHIEACLEFAIHPHNRFRLMWDLYVLILVFYASVHEPYKAGFCRGVTCEVSPSAAPAYSVQGGS
jgi:hypothetical protein